MGVGFLGLFDRTDHTSASEWDSRGGHEITTLQTHHTAYPSDAGSRDLMDPGGRTVSANGLLLRDGTLVEVVPGQFRAFTSASGADRWCLTVEVVNQTGGPGWEISEAQRRRLAKLHRDMAAAGLPTTPGRRGVGGLIGHSEVPDTYPTACPGPSMHLDHIAALAASDEFEDRPKEVKVRHIQYTDRRDEQLEPGAERFLKNDKGQVQDVSGGYAGPFSFTPHVYADGLPGDVVELRLDFRNRKTAKASPHYAERIVLDEAGQARVSKEFKRNTTDAVVVRVFAPASNRGPVRVSVLDIDSYLFAVA